MKQNWLKSVYNQNQFVFKLGLTVMLVGLGLIFLLSQSSNEIPNIFHNGINSHVVDTDDLVESVKDLSQIHQKDNGTEKCDIFDGEWVPNLGSLAYTNNTCKWIESHQNCMENGRTDIGYMYWKWKPKACELLRFDAKKFLEMMRDQSWAFVGDSIIRNQFHSFICLISQVEEAVVLYHDDEYHDQKWRFPTHNLTVSVIWSPFLAKSDVFEDKNGVSSPDIHVHVDILDKIWTEQYHTWDYILFSCGKWFTKPTFYYERNSILGCHACEGKHTDLGIDFAYRKTLKSLFRYIIESNHKATIFYRTATPDHFENGTWSTGGTCDRTVPANEGEFELTYFDRILQEVELQEVSKVEAEAFIKGLKVKLLDVMKLSLLRPDGHPGPLRQFDPFAKDKKAKVQYDCLHWCLPGPIDYWNDLLMNMVVNG
ncbi:protein trichome birefringence-like 24 [Rutidosis leptorrhynchoides]|uniref:protein trichome birefringence-like 24 n=1 Tax=Rutidosis leptorrhynchoides TaxID=125765 RepID=UPI003A98E417